MVSKKQIEQIKKSVLEFGFTSPALIDENNRLLAGHGRVEAAKLAGLISIPCVRLTHMSEAQKRAYVIADNQLALKAGWDEDFLAEELEALMGLEPGFDLSLTGFSIPEIDGLIANQKPEKPDDIFQLGSHRLISGDARDYETVSALLEGDLARMVFTDPPYNVPIAGNVGGQPLATSEPPAKSNSTCRKILRQSSSEYRFRAIPKPPSWKPQ